MKKKQRLGTILGVILVFALAWLFIPRLRAVGYHYVLILGPVDARLWAVERLEPLGAAATTALLTGARRRLEGAARRGPSVDQSRASDAGGDGPAGGGARR